MLRKFRLVVLSTSLVVVASLLVGCRKQADPSDQGSNAPAASTPSPRVPALPATINGGCRAAEPAFRQECLADPKSCLDPNGQEVKSNEAAFGAILNRGTYLNACGVPASTALTICASVRHGKVLGVTVETDPANDTLGKCVAKAVSEFPFPASPGLDIATTKFAAQ